MAMTNKLNSAEKGAKDHKHFLGCAMAWFRGVYPEEWSAVQGLPLEEAVARMHSKYDEALEGVGG